MKPLLILYATREGQTQRIAEHLAEAARARGFAAEAVNVVAGKDISLEPYSAVIIAASVHMQRHEKEMVRFVKRHREQLERMPAAFLSVSLSEAGAEDPRATPEARAKSAADVEMMIQRFLNETGWQPSTIQAAAGALMFTKYNPLLRLVMKQVGRSAGCADTSRDYEFTDWKALDGLIDTVTRSQSIPARVP